MFFHAPPRALLGLCLVVGCIAERAAISNPKKEKHQRDCAAYLKVNDLDAANAACSLCLDFDERDAECLYNSGLVAWQRGNLPLARELIIKALRENNDLGQAYNALGRVALDEGDVDGAIGHFEHAVEIDPHFVEGRENLGMAFLRKGQREAAQEKDPTTSWDRAELEYRKLFEVVPNDPIPARDLGVLLTLRADRAPRERQSALIHDAESCFVRCLALDERSKECHGNLAHLFSATGRVDEAVAHAEACVALAPDDPLCGAELVRARELQQR